MSWWLAAWVAWGVYFAVVEGVALANSRSGDTLSEHIWQFVGARTSSTAARPATAWTRVRRAAVGLFMCALGVHFIVGSHTVGNAALVVSAVVLAVVVAGTGIVRAVRRRAAAKQEG